MVIPNYTYLKMKTSGPSGVITVCDDYTRPHEAEQEQVALAEQAVVVIELVEL